MAKVSDRMTVEEARELKQGDFVEVRLVDGRWHRAQVTDDPEYVCQSELDIGFSSIQLTLKTDDPCDMRTYDISRDAIRMDGYCRAVIKEEITAASHELMGDPSDLCDGPCNSFPFRDPTEEEYQAAVKDTIERAVERIMKRTGL